MQFKIGQTVARQDPGGHEVTFSIQSTKEARYHEELAAKGYQYKVIGGAGDVAAFELPDVPVTSATPRVHQSGEAVCVACEG